MYIKHFTELEYSKIIVLHKTVKLHKHLKEQEIIQN